MGLLASAFVTILPAKSPEGGLKKEADMSYSTSQPVAAIALCALLAGCQSGSAGGEYVTFVREVMAESAQIKEEAADGPDRSEQAERAVGIWRGEEDD